MNTIQEEAPRLEPVVEMDVFYSRSGDGFKLRQIVDGKQHSVKPATASDYLLCEILKELRTLNESQVEYTIQPTAMSDHVNEILRKAIEEPAAAQAEEEKDGN